MTDSESSNSPESTTISSLCWRRDDTYYYEDGSCILRVEDVLFNVHRSILSRDGSTFGTMFALPQGVHKEGKSDDNPIVLHGDSAAEFRPFLSALYALPPELKSLTSPSANLSSLISIARLSNKYSFRSLETWALEAIQDYVNRKPSPILASIPSPSRYVYSRTPATLDDSLPLEGSTAHLTRLISLAQLCGHTPLLNTMINFLRELMSNSLHYAYLAMTLSDELGLTSLRGAAYLEVMQKAVIINPLEVNLGLSLVRTSDTHNNSNSQDNSDNNNNNLNTLILGAMANAVAPLAPIGGGGPFVVPAVPAAAISTTPQTSLSLFSSPTSATTTTTTTPSIPDRVSLPITPAQQLRLLSGYYRLSLTWDQLRLTPPAFEHASTCATTWHQHGCTQAWVEFWKDKTKSDAVLALGAADVVGRLRAIQKEYERWGSAAYMHNDCRTFARRRMGEVVKKVEENLSAYFEDAGGLV